MRLRGRDDADHDTASGSCGSLHRITQSCCVQQGKASRDRRRFVYVGLGCALCTWIADDGKAGASGSLGRMGRDGGGLGYHPESSIRWLGGLARWMVGWLDARLAWSTQRVPHGVMVLCVPPQRTQAEPRRAVALALTRRVSSGLAVGA